MQLSRDVGIRIWFKQREDIEINIWKRGGNDLLCVDVATWGLPDAAFTWDECDYNSHFNAQNFLFDLTFCVRWFVLFIAFVNYNCRVIGLVTSIPHLDAPVIALIVSVPCRLASQCLILLSSC